MKIKKINVSVTQVIGNQEIKTGIEADVNLSEPLQEQMDSLYLKCLESLTSFAEKIMKIK